MAKLLLMSVIFVTPIIASVAASDSKPRRGLSTAIRGMLLFNVVYVVLVMFVYPQICW